MNKIATFAILALATSMGACTGPAHSNRSLESVHQPVVRNSIFHFDVATTGGELPPSEQGRLQGWFDAMGIRYGDRISIEDPSMYGSSQAQSAIRSMVERRGLLLSDAIPVTAGSVSPGYVRVIVTRASAEVPGCPNWASQSAINWNNATSSNYGCATNSNLASMIADPNDLIKGATSDGNDPTSTTRPIKTYRDKALTGAGELKAASTTGGGK